MRLRHLAITLSKLEAHPCENVDFEQYSTDGNIASQFISSIVSFGDISPDSVVADLGAGNGILGIGALKVGAKKCIFLEVDKKACEILHNNLLSVGLTESGVIINELLDSETELSKVDLVIDAKKCIATPGFIDSHTHPIFVGNRANELQGGTEKYIHKTMIRLDKLYKRDNKKQKKLYQILFHDPVKPLSPTLHVL